MSEEESIREQTRDYAPAALMSLCESMGDPVYLQRKEDRLLLLFQAGVYFVYFGLFFLFPYLPWYGKILAVCAGALNGTKMESCLHYASHCQVFKQPWMNVVHRLSFCIIPPPAIYYKAEHAWHHKHNNSLADDTSTLTRDGKGHISVLDQIYYTFVSAVPGDVFQKMQKKHKVETVVSLLLTGALTFLLYRYDRASTLLFWIPAIVLSFVVVGTYCYVGHVPGNPYNKWRTSTYNEVVTSYDVFLSFFDFHNSAYHLTHHLYPGMHWSDLPAKQAELMPTYKENGSPVGHGFNHAIFFNPISYLLMLYQVNSQRNNMEIGPIPAAHLKGRVDADVNNNVVASTGNTTAMGDPAPDLRCRVNSDSAPK